MEESITNTKYWCDCCAKKIKEPYYVQLDRHGIIDMKYGEGITVDMQIKTAKTGPAELCKRCFNKIIKVYFELLLND